MSAIKRKIEQVEKKLDQKELLDLAYNVFKKNTPIDTGNARKNTKKEGSDTIFADYAYARRLDQGYSRQAPDGMKKPMFDEIRKHLRG